MGFRVDSLFTQEATLMRSAARDFYGRAESPNCERIQEASDQKFGAVRSLWYYINAFWILVWGLWAKPNIYPAFVYLHTF